MRVELNDKTVLIIINKQKTRASKYVACLSEASTGWQTASRAFNCIYVFGCTIRSVVRFSNVFGLKMFNTLQKVYFDVCVCALCGVDDAKSRSTSWSECNGNEWIHCVLAYLKQVFINSIWDPMTSSEHTVSSITSHKIKKLFSIFSLSLSLF